jgi:hypothetical protein
MAPGVAKTRNRAKQEHRKWYCAKGHEMWTVLIVPVKGRRRLDLVCACSGHRPMDTK